MKNYQQFKEWFQQLVHDRSFGGQSLVQNSAQIEMREVNAGAALVWQVSLFSSCHAVGCMFAPLFLLLVHCIYYSAGGGEADEALS